MITDENVKNLLDDLSRKWNFYREQKDNPKNTAKEREFFKGIMEGIDRCTKDIDFYNTT